MSPSPAAVSKATGWRPMAIRRQLVRFRHRGLRTDDVLLVSYPKSGSTWLRFLLAHVLTDRSVDFDSIREIAPPVGRHRSAPDLVPGGGRLIKSHEPLRPFYGRAGQRVIYLLRDGREVARSYFGHLQAEGDFIDGPDEFVDAFVRGAVDGFGTWSDHVLGAVAEADQDHPVLVLRYEDLRADTAKVLDSALTFIGAASPAARIESAIRANDKESMRAKEHSSAFLRGRRPGGLPFVTADERPSWSATFGPAAVRLEASLRPTLQLLGYGDDAH